MARMSRRFWNVERCALLACGRQSDAAGRATLNFAMPSTAGDGTSLVIRATDGSLYGELRFLLKAKPRDPALSPVSK